MDTLTVVAAPSSARPLPGRAAFRLVGATRRRARSSQTARTSRPRQGQPRQPSPV
jgi:hypothetical protein